MVLGTIVALLMLAAALTASPATAGAPAAAVAKAVTAVTLSFSRGPTEAGQQTLPESDFPTNIVTAWAAFDSEGYTSGTRLNALVRANGRDFTTIDLACCPSSGGNVSVTNVMRMTWRHGLVVGTSFIRSLSGLSRGGVGTRHHARQSQFPCCRLRRDGGRGVNDQVLHQDHQHHHQWHGEQHTERAEQQAEDEHRDQTECGW